MGNEQSGSTNRREHMRVEAGLDFCITVVEGVDHENDTLEYGKCLCTKTIDISIGGLCCAHKKILHEGDRVKVSVPSAMIHSTCLTCKHVYKHKNDLEMQPVYGKVVWVRENKCGIEFTKLSARNENILAKYIWEEHLKTIRAQKKRVVRQRKF